MARHNSFQSLHTFPLAERLEPEVEDGNTEYKLHLVKLDPDLLQHRVTQLNWRLNEGNGFAVYHIGVCDDGYPHGISGSDIDSSLQTLEQMAEKANSRVEIVSKRRGWGTRTDMMGTNYSSILSSNNIISKTLIVGCDDEACRVGLMDLFTAEVHFRRDGLGPAGLISPLNIEADFTKRAPSCAEFHLPVLLLGDSDSGKTSLIASLVYGISDDGKGFARQKIAKHVHEVVSNCGTTAINQYPHKILEPGHGHSLASLIAIDTPGQPAHVRTTLHAMVSRDWRFNINQRVDIPMGGFLFCLSVTSGISNVARELWGAAVHGCDILPLAIVLTHCDDEELIEVDVENFIAELTIVFGITLVTFQDELRNDRVCLRPTTTEEVDSVVSRMFSSFEGEIKGSVIPIFVTSSKRSESTALLSRFLALLARRMNDVFCEALSSELEICSLSSEAVRVRVLDNHETFPFSANSANFYCQVSSGMLQQGSTLQLWISSLLDLKKIGFAESENPGKLSATHSMVSMSPTVTKFAGRSSSTGSSPTESLRKRGKSQDWRRHKSEVDAGNWTSGWMPVRVESLTVDGRDVAQVFAGQFANVCVSRKHTAPFAPINSSQSCISDDMFVDISRLKVPGMIMMAHSPDSTSSKEISLKKTLRCRDFLATVLVLRHPTPLTAGYEAVIELGASGGRQVASIVSIETSDGVLSNGQSAICRLRFLYHPEIVSMAKPSFILRESRTVAIGKIVQIIE